MGFCIKCASQQVSAVGPFRQHKTRQGGGPFSRHMSEMTLPGREDSLQSLKCLGVSFWFRGKYVVLFIFSHFTLGFFNLFSVP